MSLLRTRNKGKPNRSEVTHLTFKQQMRQNRRLHRNSDVTLARFRPLHPACKCLADGTCLWPSMRSGKIISFENRSVRVVFVMQPFDNSTGQQDDCDASVRSARLVPSVVNHRIFVVRRLAMDPTTPQKSKCFSSPFFVR